MKNEEKAFVTCADAAKRWGISDRRVRVLCEDGLVDGVVRKGKFWRIPTSAAKPRDGRELRGLGVPRELRGLFAEIDALRTKLAARRPLTGGERMASGRTRRGGTIPSSRSRSCS